MLHGSISLMFIYSISDAFGSLFHSVHQEHRIINLVYLPLLFLYVFKLFVRKYVRLSTFLISLWIIMYGHHYLTFLGVTKHRDGLEWDVMYRNKPEYAVTRRNNSGIKPNDTGIHLIPKWPPFRYSFVFIQIRP